MSVEEEESIASIQLDFNSGEKFELSYIDNSGASKQPWVVHRAPLGSHERFIALLLEYFDGQLPGWLSPIQVYLLPVGEEQYEAAQTLADKMIKDNVRVLVDQNAGSLSKRILFAHKLRPFSKIIIGPKEVNSGKYILECRESKAEMDSALLFEHIKILLASP